MKRGLSRDEETYRSAKSKRKSKLGLKVNYEKVWLGKHRVQSVSGPVWGLVGEWKSGSGFRRVVSEQHSDITEKSEGWGVKAN